MKSYEFLEKYLDTVEKVYREGRDDLTPFRASSAGKCARQSGYLKLFIENKLSLDVQPGSDKDARVLSLLQLGHVLHDVERDLIEKMEGVELVDREKEVKYVMVMDDMESFEIVGHVDGILQFPNDSVILDIKTASGSSFNKIRSMGLPYDYRCQAQVYLDATGLDRFWFLFYNKDTSDRMIIEYDSNPEISAEVRTRFRSIYNTEDEASLPSREFHPYRRRRDKKLTSIMVLDAVCTRCFARELCYPDFKLEEGSDKHFVIDLESINE